MTNKRIIFFLVIPLLVYAFQNCSSATTGFSISDEEREYFESTSEKTIEIDVKDRSNAPNNLKIAFFVDESLSMNAVKGRVSQGLESLAKRITGLRASVRFFGVSQTSPAYANIDITTLSVNQYWNSKEVFATSARNLGVVKNDFSTSVLNGYKNLAPVNVSSENGRIALARVLANDTDQSFFKSGDVGVAVVISDEDDPIATESSNTNSAFKIPGRLLRSLKIPRLVTQIGLSYKETISDGGVSNQVDKYTQVILISSKYTCLSDTDQGALTVVRQWYGGNPWASLSSLKVTYCNNNVESDIHLSESSIVLPPNQVFGCGMTNFKFGNGTYTYSNLGRFLESVYEVNTTVCELVSPIDSAGAVVNGDFLRNQTLSKSLKTIMTEQTGKSTVNEFIREKALNLFGENKFYFVGLINNSDKDPNCPLSAEQKIGQSYIDLAQLLNGKTHSICSPSYSNVMDELSEFISKEIDGYHISLGRRINSATLIKPNGDRINLVAGTDYRFDGEYFALLSDKPVAGDKVVIKYQ